MTTRPEQKPLAKNTAEDLALLAEHSRGFDEDGVEIVYGFPRTNDPRDFLADPLQSEPREIERWAADFRKAQAGIQNDPAMPYSLYNSDGHEVVHMTPSTWGFGTTRYFDRDDEVLE